MQVGGKGTKYGLFIPPKKAAARSEQQAASRPLAVFAAAAREEEEVARKRHGAVTAMLSVDQVSSRQAKQARAAMLCGSTSAARPDHAPQVAQLHQAALAEDSSIFDYDGWKERAQQEEERAQVQQFHGGQRARGVRASCGRGWARHSHATVRGGHCVQLQQQQPKYIGALMKKAEERKRTMDMVYERCACCAWCGPHAHVWLTRVSGNC